MMATGCVFSLLIEDQGLIKVNLSAILDPFDSDCFMLCPWVMLFFEKFCPDPFPLVTRKANSTCPEALESESKEKS